MYHVSARRHRHIDGIYGSAYLRRELAQTADNACTNNTIRSGTYCRAAVGWTAATRDAAHRLSRTSQTVCSQSMNRGIRPVRTHICHLSIC